MIFCMLAGCLLCWLYPSLRKQPAEVLACAERAEAHWLEVKMGTRERAGATHLRGIGHRLARDYTAAIAAHREAVEL